MISMRTLYIVVGIVFIAFIARSANFATSVSTIDTNPSFSEGSNYRGFLVKKSINIEELDIKMIELVHEKTGARVLHLAKDDPENLFCLSFRTFPERSDGAAHILEHTVLCGSEKYPVTDLFQSIRNRSLNTFLNAMTGDDFTCYPGSSQVEQDFYNLLSVYTDSVFHPTIHHLSFHQEGHRLEFADPYDPASPLEVKGVVYNEMKGVLSQPQRRLREAVCEKLFPNSTYGVNSGGDPKVIPTLTHEELIAFHKKYYHPSQCLFYFYGDLPLQKHLDFLLENALKDVEKRERLLNPPKQKRLLAREAHECFYPAETKDSVKDSTYITNSYLTCSTLDQKKVLALTLIDSILMGSDASYLRRALIQSNLCKQVHSELDIESYEIPYSICMSGCSDEDGDKIDAMIQNTLSQIVKEGIPRNKIETALHQLELSKTEITGDGYPFGLLLFFKSGLVMQHGGAPEDGLRFKSHFYDLRKTIQENPRYLEGLIQEYLISNPHCVRVTMKPSSEFQTYEIVEEKERLQAIKEKLSQSEIDKILATSAALLQRQNTKGNLDVLPKVTINDVPKDITKYSLNEYKLGDVKVFHHPTHTNSITYANLVFPLTKVKEEDLWLYSLFAKLLPEVGCGGRNYQENIEYIEEFTGGIQSGYSLNQNVNNFSEFTPSFHINGKALDRNASYLYKLLCDVTQSPDFSDQARLKELILQHWADLKSDLSSNAHMYALYLSSSSLNSAHRIANGFYGLEYYSKIESLVENIDRDLPDLTQKLKKISDDLLLRKEAHLVITCSDTAFKESHASNFYGILELPLKDSLEFNCDFALPSPLNQARSIASGVSYTTKSFPAVSYTHPDAPKLDIATHLFYNLTLYKQIRQRGGAYGTRAIFSPTGGSFSFYSYRDPNIASTLSAFDEAIHTVSSGNFTLNDLEEAQLKAIQALDIPVSPGMRGDLAYKFLREGRKDSYRQDYRNQILMLSLDDVSSAVSKHLKQRSNESVIASLANGDLIEQENKKMVEASGFQLSLVR